MADRGRALFKTAGGELRRFLNFVLDASDGVNVSPARGVPGIMYEEGEKYRIEVPSVGGIHLSVHGDGNVHVRANDGGTRFDSATFPPLRDLAAPTYVLEIHPASIASYPPLDKPRPGDEEIPIGEVEDAGFVAAIAVMGRRRPSDPERRAYPSVEFATGPTELRHTRHVIGELEFQVSLISLAKGKKPYPPDEWWRLVKPQEPGDALPRPWGGTKEPGPWKHPDESEGE